MIKKTGFLIILCFLFLIVLDVNLQASFIDIGASFSSEFFRNPAGRSSATDSSDAAAYNPAGTVNIGDGLFFNLSNQTLIKNFSIEDNATGQEYESDKPDLTVPNLNIVWKPSDMDFSLWSHIGVLGGGGNVYYSDGAPAINTLVARAMLFYDATRGGAFSGLTPSDALAALLSNDLSSVEKYHFSFKQITYQLCQSFGGAYEINNNLSLAAGVRFVESTKRNTMYQSTGFNAARKFLEAELTAQGFGGIFSVNYRPVSVIYLSLEYDTPVKLNYKVNVTTNGSDQWGGLSDMFTTMMGYEDGGEYEDDLPHRFIAGATCNITDDFDITFQGGVYVNKWGVTQESNTVENSTPGYINPYAFEIGIGYNWRLKKEITWGAGVLWNEGNVNEEYFTEVNSYNDILIISSGFMFKVDDRVNVNAGLSYNWFPDAGNSTEGSYGTGITDTFKKEMWVTAVGVQVRTF